jgi:hypothetical protein
MLPTPRPSWPGGRRPDVKHRDDEADLARAYDVIDRHTPDWMDGIIRWLRSPASRWIRIPLGLLFVIGGFLWFLPIVGIEMLPIGLLLLAQDVPLIKGFAARMVLWLGLQALRLLRWWRGRSRQRAMA